MCTKYFADGDVHKYFKPYESYINFMNVLDNLHSRCVELGVHSAAHLQEITAKQSDGGNSYSEFQQSQGLNSESKMGTLKIVETKNKNKSDPKTTDRIV